MLTVTSQPHEWSGSYIAYDTDSNIATWTERDNTFNCRVVSIVKWGAPDRKRKVSMRRIRNITPVVQRFIRHVVLYGEPKGIREGLNEHDRFFLRCDGINVLIYGVPI
jgi:hypothetical protein